MQRILVYSQCCAASTVICFQNISITRKRDLVVLPVHLHTLHPLATSNLFSASIYLPVWTLHINGIIQYVVICLLSFT